MDVEEATVDHATLFYLVGEYGKKPDGSLAPDTTGAPDQCVLGKWLLGAGAIHEGLSQYVELRERHEKLHTVSGSLIRRADRGEDVKDDLRAGGLFDTAFRSLMIGIMELASIIENPKNRKETSR